MTFMEWAGLPFSFVLIGIPVLCAVVSAGYLAHRTALQKNREAGLPVPATGNTHQMILDLVMRPDAFFRTVSEGPATLFTPFLWLVIAGIVMSLGLMAGSDPGILASGAGNLLYLNLLALVLMVTTVLLAWVGVSGIFRALSLAFGGSGSFQKILQNTGYGLAPGLILYGLVLLLGAIALTVLQIPVTPFGSPVPVSPVQAGIVTGVFLIATLWTFILMTHGLRHAEAISRAKAAVCVGVPVLLFVIFANLHYLVPA